MKNELKAIIALIVTYTVGNFLLLLNRAIYWDSWIWIPMVREKKYDLIWNLLYQSKRFIPYALYKISGLAGDPILILKLLAFFSCLLTGLFLYGILRKKLFLRIDRAFFISAFFILTPVFLVRTESSVLQHSVNIMLFFLAALVYFIAEKNKNKFLAVLNYGLAWILFFLSFYTYSLLVLYGGFMLLIFISYHQENKERPLISLLRPWLKNNFLFIILPIIFWSLKLTIWKTEGYETGYDQFITLGSSPSFIVLILWETIINGFFWPIIAPILILSRKIFFLILLINGFIIYLATKNIFSSKNINNENPMAPKEIDFDPKYYLIAGAVLFFLGFLPYFLTGKAPHIIGNPFNMRSAFLLPPGSSLIILGTLLLVIKKEWQSFVQKIILALFMTFTIYNYYGLDMDWYKQMAVIESLKNSQNENLKRATTVVFSDKISSLNWLNREIHGEEYLGYLQEVYNFQENPKFGAAEGETNYYKIQKDFVTHPYPKSFDPLKKIVNVVIATYNGPEILTVGNWLKIKRLEIFGSRQSFIGKIKDIFRIKLDINIK